MSGAGEPVTRAVIDIGSNSVRLVVYRGPERLPWPILNEKIPAGLGRTLAEDGRIPADASALALAGLARFACLLRELAVTPTRVVATAAARDAANGPEFLARVRALGFEVELLSGEEEAAGSALGIVSTIPGADGVVGDLGGGSLELVEVADGQPGRGASFPLGTLRLPKRRAGGDQAFARAVKEMLAGGGWRGAAAGRSLYLVGGSWRALAHFDMHESGSPLYDPQGYVLAPARVAELARLVEQIPPKKLRDVPGISATRAASLADATRLLEVLVRQLKPARVVTSAFGLREGLLYATLDKQTRALDPLLEAARDHARRGGGDPALADALDRWTGALFARGGSLRRAACRLATIGVEAERALRARRGADNALHERWAGIDAPGRACLAQALHVAALGKGTAPDLARLAEPDQLARATAWGLAIHLGMRLSGGSADVLDRSRVAIEARSLVLQLPADLAPLHAPALEQPHRALAEALGLETATRIGTATGASPAAEDAAPETGLVPETRVGGRSAAPADI